MSFHIALDSAELDDGYDADSELLRHRGRFGDARERVMIRQRDRGESDSLGLADDVRWSARPVGSGRVGVQVDERARAVAVWSGSVHAVLSTSGDVSLGCEV